MSDNYCMPLEGEESGSPVSQPPTLDVAGVALGTLSTNDDAEVRAAAAADEQIAVNLAELQGVAAELARIIPLQQISRGRSAGIRSRLISRAMGSRDGRQGRGNEKRVKMLAPDIAPALARPDVVAHSIVSARVAQRTAASPQAATLHSTVTGQVNAMAGGRQFNWLALVAGLALVLAGTGLIRAVRNRDQLRTAAAAQQASFMSQMTVLQRAIASRDSLIASLTGPNMKVVDLLNYASQELLARMFWDQKTQEWTMYAYNLRQPKSGKVFQVWLFTNAKAQPVSAGTFTPDAHGSAVLRAKYPLSRSGLQKISVSEEPQGGATSPTGPIVMTGSGT